jgi:hypothetical protein
MSDRHALSEVISSGLTDHLQRRLQKRAYTLPRIRSIIRRKLNI